MKDDIETYYGPTGEEMVKLSDHATALTECDRQWREKVEGLVSKWMRKQTAARQMNDGYDHVTFRAVRGCANELRKLLKDSE